MVVDLQGIVDVDKRLILLTDPQVLSRNQKNMAEATWEWRASSASLRTTCVGLRARLLKCQGSRRVFCKT